MNTKFKRIVAMILVISMILTMTGCATGDGGSGNILEKLAYVAGNIAHAAVLAVGELIITGIFEGLDKLISPIEEWLGWGDWWDVQKAGVPVVIWYGRLVDPNNKFSNWDLEMEAYKEMYAKEDSGDEEQLGGMPQTGGEEPVIQFPHTGQEESTTEPPVTEAEPVIQLPQTGRKEPEKKRSIGGWLKLGWNRFLGCHHFVQNYNPEILEIECSCGKSRTPYDPNMTFDAFRGEIPKDLPQDEEYARREYARYRIYHSDECAHMDSDFVLFGLDLKTDEKVRCVQCGEELSPTLYYFSDYLEAKYRHRNYEKLDNDELINDLADYMERKDLAYTELLWRMGENSDPNKAVQTFNAVHEGLLLADGYFQLLYQDSGIYEAMINKNDFSSFYSIDNMKYSLDTFRNIMSTVGTIDSMIAFGESCNTLDREKLKGVTNIYYIDMQKIDSGIQFAQAAGNAVGFLHSLAGGQTVPGLTPDPQSFKEIIKDLDYSNVSHQIFLSLSDLNITDAEENICLEAFWEKEEKIKVQEERWPNGPTAEKTLEYIDDLSKLPGADHPALKSWYFYLGWRMEYECANMIQMILDDKI